jgi:hypothetical protein
VVSAAHPEIPDVTSLRVDDSLHQGMMSRTFRVLLDYAGDSSAAPASAVVKLSAEDPEMRMRPASRFNALKEVRFYQGLAAETDVPTPACWFADVDVDSGYHVLVLEDLSFMTARPPVEGCSKLEAQRAVSALARLHARWWESPDLESLDWLTDPAPLDPVATASRHREWWPAFLEAAGDRLPTEMMGFGERLGGRFADLMNSLLFHAPRTLRHGDYSLSNLLFAEDGPPTVLDWQMIARGKGAWDLAWFLGQSLTIEQRREWEQDLLSLYQGSLSAVGIEDYEPGACLDDYRTALAQRFGTLISSVVVLPFSVEQKAEILRVQLPRNVSAIQDHGGIELLA